MMKGKDIMESSMFSLYFRSEYGINFFSSIMEGRYNTSRGD